MWMRALAAGVVAAAAGGAWGQAYEYGVDVIEHPGGGFALYPNAINSSGVVAGWWYGSPADNRQPFIYTQSGGYQPLPNAPGLAFNVPVDINDSGVIAGWGQSTWNDEGNQVGWVLENGVFTMFPAQTPVTGINNAGRVVGHSCYAGTTFGCLFYNDDPPAHTPLPGVGAYPGTTTRNIVVNDLGQMAYTQTGAQAVFRDVDGTLTALPPPPSGWTGTRVDGINNAGQVIARWTRSTITPQLRYYSRGFVWTREGGAQEFGFTAGSVRPRGINNHGQVILESGTHDFAFFNIWVWTAATGARALEPLVDDGGLQIAWDDLYAINDAGQIVAGGIQQAPPVDDVWVVLNPITPPGPICDPIDFNNDGLFPDTLDIDDFVAVFSGGQCSNDPNCGDIDFNNDGLFPDTADIDALLRVFSGGGCA